MWSNNDDDDDEMRDAFFLEMMCRDLMAATDQLSSERPPTSTEDPSFAPHIRLQLNKVGQFGCTALHHACNNGQITLARRLIERGSHVNAVMNNGSTPLHFAVYKNQVAIAELLLANDSELELSMVMVGTPLHVAVAEGHDESTKLLLTRGALVDARICGFQPIHVASQYCAKPSIVKKLLQYGANVNDTTDGFGDTALHSAVQNSNIEVLRELLSWKPSCLNSLNTAGVTPLHIALCQHNVKAVMLLLTHNADPNIATATATQLNFSPLACAVGEPLDVSVVERLLAAGANPNGNAIDELKPLYLAVMRGNGAVVKLLCCQQGIDLNARHPEIKATPLHLASVPLAGQPNDCITKKILRSLFGDALNDSNTCTDNNASISTMDNEHPTGRRCPAQVQTVQINAQDCNGLTPLHCSLISGCNAAALFLLHRGGCDLTIKSYKLQRTALHLACAAGSCNIVKELLRSGFCNIDCRDVHGFTPLHLAIGAMGKHNKVNMETVEAMVKLLLSRGASATARDYYQGTPLQYATLLGSDSMVELIHSYIDTYGVDGRKCGIASTTTTSTTSSTSTTSTTSSTSENPPPSTSTSTSTSLMLSEVSADGDSPVDGNTTTSSGESTTTSPVGAAPVPITCDNDVGGAVSGCCVVCRERARCVLVLPCRHLSLCEECAYGSHAQQLMQQCVVCRQPVVDRLTVFL